MEFWVNLIKAEKSKQTSKGLEYLNKNCTYVNNDYWLFEGWLESLHDSVICSELGEGVVPSLGDMSTNDLIQLCMDVFAIDVGESE